MKNIVKIFVNTLKTAVFYTHTHTHTDKFCLASFLIPIFILFSVPVFATGIGATDGVADPATCDTGTLGTDTGSANLRAEFTPENINLKWYNDNTRINVASASNSCTYDDAISLPTNPTKPGYKFKGWKAIPGTRIQYIESTGTQYIDTGVPVNDHNSFEISLENIEQSYFDKYVLSQGTNSLRLTSTVLRWYSADYHYQFYSSQQNVFYKLNCGYNYLRVNDNLISGVTDIDHAGGTNVGIFGINSNHDQNSIVRIAYLKIWDAQNDLVRDMIPIKDYSGVPCMYDFVTKQIFYNSGTGNFIAGPDI